MPPEVLSRPPYLSRLDEWVNATKNYDNAMSLEVSVDQRQLREILGQGAQLFFEIIEPLKEEPWISDKLPDIERHIWVKTNDPRFNGFDPELFEGDSIRYNDKWELNIYDYHKSYHEERAELLLASGHHGSRGKKVIEVQYRAPYSDLEPPRGLIVIEDSVISYIRPDEAGEVDITEDKRLAGYPSLTICRLAVSAVRVFVEETLKKQSIAAET